jgi:hypothetical protein
MRLLKFLEIDLVHRRNIHAKAARHLIRMQVYDVPVINSAVGEFSGSKGVFLPDKIICTFGHQRIYHQNCPTPKLINSSFALSNCGKGASEPCFAIV